MAEYLRFPEYESLPKIEVDELVQKHRVFTPGILILVLEKAYEHLSTTDGANLEMRKLWADSWVGWWIEYLKNFPDNGGIFESTHRLVSPGRLGEVFAGHREAGRTSGILLGATMDGTQGHRYAVDWVKNSVVYPAVGIEMAGYFARHPERRPAYFPDAVRLSMIARLGVYVTPIPNIPVEIEESEFYDIFVRVVVHPDYSFATQGDPNALEKRGRGLMLASFTLIGELAVPHTSEQSAQLMPEEDEVTEIFDYGKMTTLK